MVNTEKKLLVDKKLLAINKDEISLLESCMVMPKIENILMLKKRLGIPLSKQEIIQEIKDKNSPLHKFFKTLVLGEIACAQWIEEENVKRILETIRKRQQKRAARLNYLQRLRRISRRIIYPKYNVLDKENDILKRKKEKTKLSAAEGSQLKYLLIENAKLEAMKYYCQFAKNQKTLNFIHEQLEKEYDQAAENLTYLDTLLSNAQDQEKENLEEYLYQYLRHLELSSAYTMHHHLSHLNLDDEMVLLQHLRKRRTNESFYARNLKCHYEKAKPSFGEKEQATDKSRFFKFEQRVPVNNKSNMKYWVFQNTLNDEIEAFFAQHQVFSCGFEEILEIQCLLHRTLYHHCASSHHLERINFYANMLLQKFLKAADSRYSGLINCLSSWSRQNKLDPPQQAESNHPNILLAEDRKALARINEVTQVIMAKENDEQLITALNKINNYLASPNEEKNKKLINTFNDLTVNYPKVEGLAEIYSELISLSFIDPEQILSLTIDKDFAS